MVDPGLTRWIKASVYKHFDAGKGPYALYLMEENIKEATQWAELRISGFRYRPVLKNEIIIEVDIHVMCSVLSSNDLYAVERIVGHFKALFTDILVKKYGDDTSNVGCLSLRQDVPRPIDVIPWGKSNPSNNSEQTSIDGFFKMHLHG